MLLQILGVALIAMIIGMSFETGKTLVQILYLSISDRKTRRKLNIKT